MSLCFCCAALPGSTGGRHGPTPLRLCVKQPLRLRPALLARFFALCSYTVSPGENTKNSLLALAQYQSPGHVTRVKPLGAKKRANHYNLQETSIAGLFCGSDATKQRKNAAFHSHLYTKITPCTPASVGQDHR